MNDDMSIDYLRAHYAKHCAIVEGGTVKGKALAWHICLARGYRRFITDYAMRTGDEDAMNLVLGAPHWLTFNDGNLEALCHAN